MQHITKIITVFSVLMFTFMGCGPENQVNANCVEMSGWYIATTQVMPNRCNKKVDRYEQYVFFDDKESEICETQIFNQNRNTCSMNFESTCSNGTGLKGLRTVFDSDNALFEGVAKYDDCDIRVKIEYTRPFED